MRTGGQLLIDQLVREGVRHVFTVPGESFLAALDAMHDEVGLSPIVCRNEAGAAMMAEATGKLTGRPGVALVTRAPGATNALAGFYIAHNDASPLVLIVGLPPRSAEALPAFQAIDIQAVFGSLAKDVAIVSRADLMAESVHRAFKAALSERPGPVVLAIPEDVFEEQTEEGARDALELKRKSPADAAIETLHRLLAAAERPLVLAGASQWSEAGAAALQVFAEKFDLPVAATFRRQDRIDNRHRSYIGHAGIAMSPHLSAAIRASDLVIALGDGLGDITTQGFTLLRPPLAAQKLVLIAPDAGAADAVFTPTVAIEASPILAAEALSRLDAPRNPPPWQTWRHELRAAYEASLTPHATPGAVQLEEVMRHLSAAVPNAIVTNGAGNYTSFVHRYVVYKTFPSQLAPVSGSMGYGLPAAIAAKLAYPERTVIAVAGDGCFQMTAQELQTAVQFALPIVIIVANNRSLGTIRMHQERRFPGRVIATTLLNPDFVKLAESAGAFGERVTATRAFPAALQRAIDAGRPALIELATDTEAISPTETLTSIAAKSSLGKG